VDELGNIIKQTVIPLLVTLITLYVTKRLSKRETNSVVKSNEGEAAESLSVAASKIVETYQTEIVVPLRLQLAEWVKKLAEVEANNGKAIKDLQTKVIELNRQIDFMRGELLRSDNALEYLVGAVQVQHPAEARQALRIRRGEIT